MNKLYFLLLLSVVFGYAQNPAGLDPTFNIKDEMPTDVGSILAFTSDGKIVSTSGYKTYDGQLQVQQSLTRYNPDLTVDESFQIQGTGFNNVVVGAAVQPDNKIIVVGLFTAYNGTPVSKIVRLNANGSLDTSFNLSGIDNPASIITPKKAAVLPNGKILVSGKFSMGSGAFSSSGLARLNSNGALDTGFDNAVYTGSEGVQNFWLVPGNKILLLTNHSLSGSSVNDSFKIDRVSSDGILDTSFTPITGFTGLCTNVSTVKVQLRADGKIFVAGCFVNYYLQETLGLKRFNANGTNDTTFSYYGTSADYIKVSDFVILPDNTIRAISNFTSPLNVTRIEADGALNNNGMEPKETGSTVANITLQPDGNLLARTSNEKYNATGSPTTYTKYVRMDTDGRVLANQQQITWYPGRSLLTLPDNSLVALGNIQRRGNMRYHFGIRHTTADGEIIYDPQLYNGALAGVNNAETNLNYLKKGVTQSDGKIVAVRVTTPINPLDPAVGTVVRFNPDFTPDAAFTVAQATTAGVNMFTYKQTNGKILFGTAFGLFRWEANGAGDTAFNANLPVFNGRVMAFGEQADGKLLVGGVFSTYNGTAVNRLCRLLANGTIDPSFTAPTLSFSYVSGIGVQSDGKIIVSGLLNGIPGGYNNMLRLNSDGSIDASFTALTHGSLIGRDVIVLPDNKIVYTLVPLSSSIENPILGRLNANGTPDLTFDTGSGFNGRINDVMLTPNGRLLVTGNFTQYNGTYCNGTVRLAGGDGTLGTTEETTVEANQFAVFPNPTHDLINIRTSAKEALLSVEVYDVMGQLQIKVLQAQAKESIDVSRLATGIYVVKFQTQSGASQIRFIKK